MTAYSDKKCYLICSLQLNRSNELYACNESCLYIHITFSRPKLFQQVRWTRDQADDFEDEMKWGLHDSFNIPDIQRMHAH